MESVETVAVVCLWACLGLIAFIYIGYPLTLAVLPPTPQRRQRPAVAPRVTVLIAAYNEVRDIVATVRNKLEQSYPADRLDVIVVSDGSTDGTDEAVEGLRSSRVKLLRQQPRQGKTMALNRAILETTSEIAVFSDANSLYAPDAVERLVAAFEDPTVGYVTGSLQYRNPGETAVGTGSGVYMRYENWLRRLESRVGSVIGVNGGVDAVRRSLYEPMRADHLPDFVLPLRVAAAGHRVVFCEEAVASEDALGRQDDEYRMRVRVSLRALHTLAEMRSLLHPRYGLLAFELLVHKLLRYLVALPLAVAFVSSAILAGRPIYALLLAAQSICYGLAAVGWIAGGRISWKPIFVPFYFCLINVAAVAALIRFLRGQRTVLWTPRKGA